MSDLIRAIQQHSDLSIEAQIQAGKPLGDGMPKEHIAYVQELAELVDRDGLVPHEPQTLVAKGAYDAADEPEQGKIDLVLPTIADTVRHIISFYRDPATPNACPQLKTMIEHLWEMLRRLGPSSALLKLPYPPSA